MPCPVLAMNVGDTDIDSLEEVRGRSEATVAEPAREAVRIVRSETIPVCDLPQGGVEDAGGRRADVSGSDTDSLVESDGDEHVRGSVASGEDDDIELPIVEPVAPVFPSAAAQRARFTQLDQWGRGRHFLTSGVSDEDCATFLMGVFLHRMETLFAFAQDVAQVPQRRIDWA